MDVSTKIAGPDVPAGDTCTSFLKDNYKAGRETLVIQGSTSLPYTDAVTITP